MKRKLPCCGKYKTGLGYGPPKNSFECGSDAIVH